MNDMHDVYKYCVKIDVYIKTFLLLISIHTEMKKDEESYKALQHAFLNGSSDQLAVLKLILNVIHGNEIALSRFHGVRLQTLSNDVHFLYVCSSSLFYFSLFLHHTMTKKITLSTLFKINTKELSFMIKKEHKYLPCLSIVCN